MYAMKRYPNMQNTHDLYQNEFENGQTEARDSTLINWPLQQS
jgi:hypothetical protein